MALRKGLMGKKQSSSKGYKVAGNTERDELQKTCVLISTELRGFMDEFIYEYKKETGNHTTVSEVIRVALKSFKALSREKQRRLLKK